jgi:hypothetical protein
VRSPLTRPTLGLRAEVAKAERSFFAQTRAAWPDVAGCPRSRARVASIEVGAGRRLRGSSVPGGHGRCR